MKQAIPLPKRAFVLDRVNLILDLNGKPRPTSKADSNGCQRRCHERLIWLKLLDTKAKPTWSLTLTAASIW